MTLDNQIRKKNPIKRFLKSVILLALLFITLTNCKDKNTVPYILNKKSSLISDNNSQSQTVVKLSKDDDPNEVIKKYYIAINNKDYLKAYKCWENEGKASKKTFKSFKSGFRNTVSVRFEAGQVEFDAGAGSQFAEIPITITATHTDSSYHTYKGQYILRKSNIEGSESYKNWHIHSAKLKEAKLNIKTIK